MARDDPYRMMTLVFGVLLVVALIALYFVVGSPAGSAAPHGDQTGNGYTGNSPNLTGNTPKQNSVIYLANTTQNRSLLHLAKMVSSSGSNSTLSQVTIVPGKCTSIALYTSMNVSTSEAQASSTGYYLITANATQKTFVQMSATAASPQLFLTSENFTAVSMLRVPANSQLFFCNPTQQYDDVTYAITK